MKKTDLKYEVAKAVGDIDEKFYTEDYSLKKAKKISKTFLILVAMIGVLTAGASITGVYNQVRSHFAQRYGDSPEELQVIQEIARPVDGSASSQGLTLSVDGIMGDGSSAEIVYSIAKEDGTPIFLPSLSENHFPADLEQIPDETYTWYHWGFGDLEDLDEYGFPCMTGTQIDRFAIGTFGSDFEFIIEDNIFLGFVEKLKGDKLPLGEQASALFSDFGYWQTKTTYENGIVIDTQRDFTSVLEGKWQIDYFFSYGESQSILLENHLISSDGMDVYLTKLEITALSYEFQIEIPFSIEEQEGLSEIEIEEALWEGQLKTLEMVDNLPFILTLKDGTDQQLPVVTTSGSFNGESRNWKGFYPFENILLLEEIASVTFGDMTVEVNS